MNLIEKNTTPGQGIQDQEKSREFEGLMKRVCTNKTAFGWDFIPLFPPTSAATDSITRSPEKYHWRDSGSEEEPEIQDQKKSREFEGLVRICTIKTAFGWDFIPLILPTSAATGLVTFKYHWRDSGSGEEPLSEEGLHKHKTNTQTAEGSSSCPAVANRSFMPLLTVQYTYHSYRYVYTPTTTTGDVARGRIAYPSFSRFIESSHLLPFLNV
ncbi:hypothetical protein J6590_077571 [Homalodisca vitripennis]|nr:hypothetical protein J6590_077571 [Homalodisca vitripennis]